MRKRLPLEDPLDPKPPALLRNREARVDLHQPNTLRVGFDRKEDNSDAYYTHNGPRVANDPTSSEPIRLNNEVMYLIDSAETFAAMAEVINEASGPEDFIYLAGWWLSLDFDLIPGHTMRRMLGEAAGTVTTAVEAQPTHAAAIQAGVALSKLSSLLTLGGTQFWDGGGFALLRQFDAHAGQARDRLRDACIAAGSVYPKQDQLEILNRFSLALENPGRTEVEAAELVALATQCYEAVDATVAWAYSNALANRNAKDRSVQVRLMLWDDAYLVTGNHNTPVVAWANGLYRGLAVLDNKTLNFGTHHQKILVVRHGGQLTAFCGGLDINTDRSFAQGEGPNIHGDTGGAPFHDVHCRIRGPAVYDLLGTFLRRWKDRMEGTADLAGESKLRGEDVRLEDLPAQGRLKVRICRTSGSLGWWSNSYAPHGERSIREMFLRAISQAQEYIYVEDQYLTCQEASEALLARLPYIKKLILLMPPDRYADMAGHQSDRRERFLLKLVAHQDKVDVWTLRRRPEEPNWPDWHTYVHCKTWIIDDRFAIIGSANCNRRSWTHDSEVAAAIYDTSTDLKCGWTFARQLRVALWAEHLGMQTPEGWAELADPIASSIHWHKAALEEPGYARGRVSLYKNEKLSGSWVKTWDTAVDPDGTTP